MRRTGLIIGLLLILAILLALATSGPAQIEIANRSEESFQNVVASGNSFSFREVEIKPGEEVCFTAGNFGESDLALSGLLGANPLDASNLAYLEGGNGYFVRLEVWSPSRIVVKTSTSNIRRPWCKPAA